MKNKITIIFVLILIFFLNYSFSFAQTQNGINVNLNVAGNCNNNGVCEAGEDMFSCSFDCTPVTPPNTGGNGNSTGSVPLPMNNVFKDLTVEVGFHSAIIKWHSVMPTMSVLRFGDNLDYKNGVIKNINFIFEHRVEINNLKDGTIYYFSIQAENLLKKINTLENQTFKTLSLPDTTPPENPTNIIIERDASGFVINWQNPNDEDFDYVRVLRGVDKKKIGPFYGKVVYEGRGQYLRDVDVLPGKEYVYSFFIRDKIGNYSSGVSVRASLSLPILNKENIEPINQVDPKKEVKSITKKLDEETKCKFFDIIWPLVLLILITFLITKRILANKNKCF